MLAGSLTNLASTVTASSAAAGYPVSFVVAVGTPDIPWKSTATTDQWIIVDLGSAVPVGIVALLWANFTGATLQADDAITFDSDGGDPQYEAEITLGENPGNGRYCCVHIPTVTITRRYWRVLIPSQDRTDDAAYFRLGGLFLGAVTYFRNFAWDYENTSDQKTAVVETIGGAEEESILGPVRFHITGTLKPLTGKTLAEASATVLLNDQVFDLAHFARAWKAAGQALIAFRPDHPYWVCMMRIVGMVKTRVGYPAAEWSFEWKEKA